MTASADTFARPKAPEHIAPRLSEALSRGGSALDVLAEAAPVDRRDRFETLLQIYALSTGSLAELGDRARHAGAPSIAALKARLEAEWMAELEAKALPVSVPTDAVNGMRALAARDRLPTAYRWLASEAGWEELVRFLAIEGGPDGGFDDLVAICQVGLTGSAKLELAQNYWDEMGNGHSSGVHTAMYEAMAAAIEMPRIPRSEQPVEALERIALGGLFATNHWLQPEMIGALGLLELQAGPRCRLVLKAFERLCASAEARPFYAEHADVDPRHGKDWLERAVGPLCETQPDWAPRILRGAWWRACTNAALFDVLVQEIQQTSVDVEAA